MAEPYAKPNKEHIKKLISFVGDSFGYHLMVCGIEAMKRVNPETYDVQESQFGEWKFLTRRLLWNFGLFQVIEHVYRLNEENSEQYWDNFEAPEKEPKEEYKMIPEEWRSG